MSTDIVEIKDLWENDPIIKKTTKKLLSQIRLRTNNSGLKGNEIIVILNLVDLALNEGEK